MIRRKRPARAKKKQRKKGKMNTKEAIRLATSTLQGMKGRTLDILTIGRPRDIQSGVEFAKIVSKLSPILGNYIELSSVNHLNDSQEFVGLGRWRRQDPGFPDAIFEGAISPTPGFEIKAWFPLATEITARFKESQSNLRDGRTSIVLMAWIPEHLIYGRPQILDVCVFPGLSVAEARDRHYHKPPGYLVIEPNDTSSRTRNLQQTNTNGFKWQGSPAQLTKAEAEVAGWGARGREYSTDEAYQRRLARLQGQYDYRGDTNYAKIDRIEHEGIEAFKSQVLARTHGGLSLSAWAKLLSAKPDSVETIAALRDKLNIR